jgi:hypothetical protein
MRERLITFGLALAALLLFLTLFVRGEAPDARPPSVPTSIDRGDNGLAGALAWLRAEGVRALALRERLGSLAQRRDLPAAGNLLIVTLPAQLPFRTDEAVALDRWIRNGNTLLILAAISDRPAWGRDRGVLDSDLQLLSGLRIDLARTRERCAGENCPSPAKDAAGAKAVPGGSEREAESPTERVISATRLLDKPLRETLVPNRPHRYLEAVAAAYAFSDYPPRAWDVRVPRDAFPLSLAHARDSGEGVLWLLPDGAGNMVVSAYGSLFSNRALGQGDNARLLANIVSASVQEQGTVLFDDEHQGLSESYDPAKFYRDRRLYLTLAIIAGMWLVWVIGGTRLQMPPAPPPAPREEDLVRATGMFLARVLRPAAVARRMYEHFFARLRRSTPGTSHEAAACWELLEHNPRLARTDVVQLKEWYAKAYSDERVPLAHLRNLIVKTERQLAA